MSANVDPHGVPSTHEPSSETAGEGLVEELSPPPVAASSAQFHVHDAEPSASRPAEETPHALASDAQVDAQGGALGVDLRTRLLWGAAILLCLTGIVLLANSVRSVAVPLLVALVIAYLLDPVVDRFEARGVGRTPAIILLLAIALIVGAAVTFLVIPQIFREFGEVPAKLSLLLTKAGPWIEGRLGVELPNSIQETLGLLVGQLESSELQGLAAPLGRVLKTVFGGTVSLIASLAGLMMIPVFAFYLLRDFDRLVAQVHGLIPRLYQVPISARFREIDGTMSAFVRGQMTVASILAVLYSLGFWAVGLPMATLVGVGVGLGNMVPYLGSGLGLVLATALCLMDWQGPGTLLSVYAVFLVVQGLEGWVITPKIVGESVGLSPFVVIVAVLVFGQLFGFLGVLIAVPLAAILKILLRVILEFYRESAFFQA